MRFMIEDILKKVDAILIYNQGEPMVDLNFFYFSRLLESGLFEGSYILIDNDKRVIITSELEETSAKKSDFQIEIFRKNQEKYELLSKYLGGKKKIGISFSSISLKEFNNLRDKFNELEFVDIENELSGLRQIKNDFEISLIKEAGKIASDVAEEIINYIREGITENELAAKLTYLITRNYPKSL